MSDLEGWSRVIEDDNDQKDKEAQTKLKTENHTSPDN
jgi:hypothetical protein